MIKGIRILLREFIDYIDMDLHESLVDRFIKYKLESENYIIDETSTSENEIFITETNIDFSILNDNDIFYIKTSDSRYEFLFKGSNPFNDCVQGVYINCEYYETFNNNITNEQNVKELRLATHDEIELYYKIYSQATNYNKEQLLETNDGVVIWCIRETSDEHFEGILLDGGTQNEIGLHYDKWEKNISLPTNKEIPGDIPCKFWNDENDFAIGRYYERGDYLNFRPLSRKDVSILYEKIDKSMEDK